MTQDVITVTETSPLDTVVRLMERHGIKRLPVVRDGNVVGIVSRANLLHALVALRGADAPSVASDTVIRRRILQEIRREPWGPRGSVNVVVRDGAVDLWGSLFDERERQALRVIVENVAGVKAIHDHMVWIDPLSGAMIEAPHEATT